MAKKSLPLGRPPALVAPVPVAEPIEPNGDLRRAIREMGPHNAKSIAIIQDMMVFDAAVYASLNGILAHHGLDIDPAAAAKRAIECAKELVEQRRAVKKA